MARTGDHIPIAAKRALWFQSHGRCQYLDCDLELLAVDSATGAFTELGEFAHILPVGEGPRQEYKGQFPQIDLNSAANLIYLCGHHHTIVDKTEVDRHPPMKLFGMKVQKSNFIGAGISDFLQAHCSPELNINNFIDEYAVSGVLDKFKRARDLGPLDGRELFEAARKTMLSLLKNPFIVQSVEVKSVIETEHCLTALYIYYRSQLWDRARSTVLSVLQRALSPATVYHICSGAMILVRDEFQLLPRPERLSMISALIRKMDELPHVSGLPFAFRLLLKSAMLRWRGRLERGQNQRNTYGEAKRCCDKSYQISQDSGCVLQSALIAVSTGMGFQYREFPAHERFFEEAFVAIESSELALVSSAQLYRARLYRDTYRFSDSAEAFWISSSMRPSEAKRTAYILAEAVVGQHYHRGGASRQSLLDALSFVQDAIESGFDHGRNIAAYISSRSIIEPKWFKDEVIKNLFRGEEMVVEWTSILETARQIIAPSKTDSELTFGIDEAEFWNTIAICAGRVLNDTPFAVKIYHIAERHAEISGGKFRARFGLARYYYLLDKESDCRHYIRGAKDVARSHQAPLLHELEAAAREKWG